MYHRWAAALDMQGGGSGDSVTVTRHACACTRELENWSAQWSSASTAAAGVRAFSDGYSAGRQGRIVDG